MKYWHADILAIRFGHVHVMGQAFAEDVAMGVRHQDALGWPRGARCVHDAGNVLGCWRDEDIACIMGRNIMIEQGLEGHGLYAGQQAGALCRHVPRHINHRLELAAAAPDAIKGIAKIIIEEQHPRFRVAHLVFQKGALQFGIDRDEDGAQLHDREHGQHEFDAVLQYGHDPVAGNNTQPGQITGEAIAVPIE
jgi:hypothetical protein